MKASKRKFTATAEEIEEERQQNELEAEMKAVEAMRAEKQGKIPNHNSAGSVTTTYNKEGMLQALNNLAVNKLGFVETLQICEFDVNIANDNDDLEREIAFYNQTLLAVESARNKLTAAGIPFKRPNDYFCESVKSDAHMNRVKDRLIMEEKRMEAFEKRKQREVSRKYDKQVAAVRKQEHATRVKAEINEVSKLRKGDNSNPAAKRQKLNEVLEDSSHQGKSKKRMIMDKKYGSGIKQKMRSKLNDQKSLNDFKDFNPRGGKFARKKTAGSGSGGRPSGGRPTGGRGGRGAGGRGAGGRGSGGRGGRGGGGRK